MHTDDYSNIEWNYVEVKETCCQPNELSNITLNELFKLCNWKKQKLKCVRLNFLSLSKLIGFHFTNSSHIDSSPFLFLIMKENSISIECRFHTLISDVMLYVEMMWWNIETLLESFNSIENCYIGKLQNQHIKNFPQCYRKVFFTSSLNSTVWAC